MARDDLPSIIEAHRRRWPLERVAAEAEAFRCECEQVLRRIPDPETVQWPDLFWARLMFGEPARPAE